MRFCCRACIAYCIGLSLLLVAVTLKASMGCWCFADAAGAQSACCLPRRVSRLAALLGTLMMFQHRGVCHVCLPNGCLMLPVLFFLQEILRRPAFSCEVSCRFGMHNVRPPGVCRVTGVLRTRQNGVCLCHVQWIDCACAGAFWARAVDYVCVQVS